MKKFTSLMLMLLCAVTAWAGPTDLPEITTDLDNPIYYTIVNTRSSQPGGFMYFAGENVGIKDEQVLAIEAKHKFYFTGSHDALYVHNAATDKKLASIGDGNNAAGSWTEAGAVWAVGVSPKGTGLAFGPQGGLNGGACWNECNYATNADKPDFTTWSANDDGSVFVVYLAEEYGVEVGKLYTIECPLFENVQGVAKGAYANESGDGLYWSTVDLKNKHFYWTPVRMDNGTIAIKNLAREVYINGAAVGEPASVTAKLLGSNQFNITTNGVKLHAAGHNNGAGSDGGMTSWDGGANSASGWRFVEREDPDAVREITVIYNFTYNGETTSYSQTVETVTGAEYPAISAKLPFGITAKRPEGTIANDAESTLTLTIPLEENLPFTYAARYDEIENWYYVKIKDANYLYHTEGQNYIDLTKTAVAAENRSAYSWAFVGNPFDGFQIVNKAAGEGYILSSSTTTTDGTDGGNTFPVMTATPVADGNNELWVLSKSTHTTNGFYIEQKGYQNNKMNHRDNKLAYWNAGADKGSTFNVELRPSAKDELLVLAEQAKSLLEQMNGYIGDGLGKYSSSYEDFKAAYDEIAAYVAAGNIEDAVAEVYLVELFTIINSFSLNMPEKGKYYRFKSVDNTYLTTPATTGVPMALTEEATNSVLYWDNDGHLLVYSSGMYMNGKNHAVMGNKATYAIEASKTGAVGRYAIKPSNANYWHADDANLNVWSGGTNEKCNWTIEEVETLPVSITAAGYATFYAPVAVTVADGVTAYTVTVDGEKATLSDIESGVIPANTGVVLAGAEGTYNFAITTAAAFEGENALRGTAAATYISDEAYVLGYINVAEEGQPEKKEVGFYTATMNQQDNKAWKNNSHKAYLPKPAGSGAAYYSFRFPGTTGVENVEVENEVKAIYDLTGRRVENVTAPGIYIVNGKKVLVK